MGQLLPRSLAASESSPPAATQTALRYSHWQVATVLQPHCSRRESRAAHLAHTIDPRSAHPVHRAWCRLLLPLLSPMDIPSSDFPHASVYPPLSDPANSAWPLTRSQLPPVAYSRGRRA